MIVALPDDFHAPHFLAQKAYFLLERPGTSSRALSVMFSGHFVSPLGRMSWKIAAARKKTIPRGDVVPSASVSSGDRSGKSVNTFLCSRRADESPRFRGAIDHLASMAAALPRIRGPAALTSSVWPFRWL